MNAANSRPRTRLLVVDFLATLFVTFCIGVATALVLGMCVMLMAGDAHGAAPARPAPAPATTSDLVLAHYFAARHAGLALAGRIPAAAAQAAKPDRGERKAPVAN
jgi:hypothetical protein